MVAKEFCYKLDKPLLKEGCDIDCDDDPYLQQDVDDEAAEETLSLCDLAVNSNDTEDYSWSSTTDFSKEEGSSSSDQDDFFEFFSEDFTSASSITYPKDNIIFCGKLIPYKENNAVPQQTRITNTQQKLNNERSFPWKSQSFNKPRTGSSKAQHQEKITCYKRAVNQKYECDLSVKRVSTIATPAVKSSRWYLFAFGHGRFPTEMELRDIKNRQSRRNPAATMFGLGNGGGVGGEMNKKSEKRSKGKTLWRLLRVLGCKSQQANAGMKASFGCVPHERETRSA